MESCHIVTIPFGFSPVIIYNKFMKSIDSLDKNVFNFQLKSGFLSYSIVGDAGFFKMSIASLP